VSGGIEWAELEAAAPELAAAGRRAVERYGFVFLGTLRRDGGPRISPVAAHFVGGRLMLALIPRSRKARDLARDPRVCLQSPIADPDEPGDELKLNGRVVDADPGQRAATADAIERAAGWRPADRVDLLQAASLTEADTRRMERVLEEGGLALLPECVTDAELATWRQAWPRATVRRDPKVPSRGCIIIGRRVAIRRGLLSPEEGGEIHDEAEP
jgi:hypothetical protein